MKTVLVFGCFDLLHPGHIWFLSRAKRYGNKLVVVVARDIQIQRIKGHAPHMNENDRAALLKSLRMIDEVLLGDKDYHYERLVKKIKPDIIVLGYDQQETEEEITQRLAKVGLNPKIVRLKAYKPARYKSSKLKMSS